MEVQCPFQITLQQVKFDGFTDYFFDKFDEYGCNLAMVDLESGRLWNYSELRICTENCAQRLQEIGVGQRTRCALICSVTAQAIIVYIACAMLDATVISVNPSLTSGEIWAQLEKSQVVYCFTEENKLSKLKNVRRTGAVLSGRRILSVRLLDEIFGSAKLFINHESLVPSGQTQTKLKLKNKRQLHEVFRTDLSLSERSDQDEGQITDSEPNSVLAASFQKRAIHLTKTAKFPKPTEVSRYSLLHNLQQLSCPIFGPPSVDDKCLLATNIHHIFGLVTAFLALKNGAQLIVTPEQNPRQVIDIIKKWKVTMAYVIPIFIHQCSKDINLEKDGLESLKSIVTSGAPIGEATMQLCKERLKLQDLRQAYSITKAGGICSLAPYGQETLKSVGIPMPGLRFKVMDFGMKETCMPRQLGQILIHHSHMETPAHKNPEQVNATFVSEFFKTGDAGYYDEMGYIFVVNKMKDIVRCKDLLLWPSEVESALHDHPGIDDCTVVGKWEYLSGTVVPTAFVVRNELHQQLTRNELIRYVTNKVPNFGKLHGIIHFVPEIPRGVCGKILRPQLDQIWNHVSANCRNVPNSLNDNSNKKVVTTKLNRTLNIANKQSATLVVTQKAATRKAVNVPKMVSVHKPNNTPK
ncbi:AMP-binding enzyme family protein [Brugia pahangi]